MHADEIIFEAKGRGALAALARWCAMETGTTKRCVRIGFSQGRQRDSSQLEHVKDQFFVKQATDIDNLEATALSFAWYL